MIILVGDRVDTVFGTGTVLEAKTSPRLPTGIEHWFTVRFDNGSVDDLPSGWILESETP